MLAVQNNSNTNASRGERVMAFELSDVWDDPEDISGYSGRNYFRIALRNRPECDIR